MKDGDTLTLITPIGIEFRVEVVESRDALRKGLSGRQSLPRGTGLFFVFGYGGPKSMWMKDMRFPLDIVWLDELYRIVHISYDNKPCGSEGECPSIPSYVPAAYAIELNAGDADVLRLYKGHTLQRR